MSIITISRGSYSRGKEVAEKVAAALGYECISREILLAARVQAALVEEFPSARVSAKEGELFVDIRGDLTEEQEIIARAQRIASHVAGIEVKMRCLIHP
jgi:hypothetical protein